MPAWPRLRSSLGMALLLLGVLTTPVLAQRSSDVENLIRKGSELRRQGKDHLALPYYQRAYDTSPTGRTAAQLGLCEMQLGYFLLASDHMGEALASNGDPWVEKYRSVLDQSLRSVKSHITDVEVAGTPSGAEVLLDEKSVGHVPLSAPLRMVAGPSHKIRLHAEGYQDGSETIAGHGGETVKLSLQLARSPVLPLQPTGPESIGRAEGLRPAPLEGGSSSTAPSGLRIAAWSTAAGAVALLAVGGAELAVASKRLDEFQTTPSQVDPARSCGTDQANSGGPTCHQLHDDWSRARTLGIVGLVAGGAFAATSTALWLVSSGGPQSPKVACVPAPGLGGVVCRHTF
jgi:hypothetical protein